MIPDIHTCPQNIERFVEVVKQNGVWLLWISCKGDMDDIKFDIAHCPFCGKVLVQGPE